MKYTKPALPYADQQRRLIDRGLVVANPQELNHWLRHVSYYRLSAYALPFKDAAKHFLPGTTFEQIANLYRFDGHLRMAIMDAIERVEVAVRSAFANSMAYRYGPFGYTDPGNFAPRFNHADFMDDLAKEENRSRETFVSHFRRKYTTEKHLPVWMAIELISFGRLSKVYKDLSPDIRRDIAKSLGTTDAVAASWLHTLTYVRNLCAHHSRLWNRVLGVQPKLPNPAVWWPYAIPDNQRLYCVMVILRHILKNVSPNCGWQGRLIRLFDDYPQIPLASMGMPDDWRTRSPWR
jgi:abortive infection bacteriophage resistance protein